MTPLESITVSIYCVNGDTSGTTTETIYGTSKITTDGVVWLQEGDYVNWNEPATGGSGTATVTVDAPLITSNGIDIALSRDYVTVVGTYYVSHTETQTPISTVNVS